MSTDIQLSKYLPPQGAETLPEYQVLQTHLPTASEILSAICALGGFRPFDLHPGHGPILPIAGVEIVNRSRRTIDDCNGHVYVSKTSLRVHQSSAHPHVEAKKRSSAGEMSGPQRS
ncbi:hypothetical protein BT96DRAFT_1000436 [Gymnopus androsaceus JB14]|uniref:Uncharacterized protein n=1 Tax=Gymnopus androsaceus JB14 TaxID=1447944 RepID=A0A6A4H2C8_9AGAR|nr:hypothetical protein BT96DRAFT_1000436 [Gymnopus androsaceus JB14]